MYLIKNKFIIKNNDISSNMKKHICKRKIEPEMYNNTFIFTEEGIYFVNIFKKNNIFKKISFNNNNIVVPSIIKNNLLVDTNCYVTKEQTYNIPKVFYEEKHNIKKYNIMNNVNFYEITINNNNLYMFNIDILSDEQLDTFNSFVKNLI